MFVRGGARVLYGLFTAVFSPSRFVKVEQTAFATSRVAAYSRVLRLSLVWLVNLVMYALPLTLSGIGFTAEESAPDWFRLAFGPMLSSPDAGWQLVVGMVQNSLFLTAATVLVFVTFHGSVQIAERSRGYLQSLYTIVYTTSVYLAGLFTLVMFVSTTDGFSGAEEFLINLQVTFIQGVVDLLGVDLTLPGVEPGPITLEGLSYAGELLLTTLFVVALYFVYSMYLGARLNHGLNRVQSAVVVIGVLASPVVYVAGSVFLTLVFDAYGITALSIILTNPPLVI
jgi:hypothetical protein